MPPCNDTPQMPAMLVLTVPPAGAGVFLAVILVGILTWFGNNFINGYWFILEEATNTPGTAYMDVYADSYINQQVGLEDQSTTISMPLSLTAEWPQWTDGVYIDPITG